MATSHPKADAVRIKVGVPRFGDQKPQSVPATDLMPGNGQHRDRAPRGSGVGDPGECIPTHRGQRNSLLRAESASRAVIREGQHLQYLLTGAQGRREKMGTFQECLPGEPAMTDPVQSGQFGDPGVAPREDQASWAIFTNCEKASASLTAKSANILRFISTPAELRPATNRE